MNFENVTVEKNGAVGVVGEGVVGLLGDVGVIACDDIVHFPALWLAAVMTTAGSHLTGVR